MNATPSSFTGADQARLLDLARHAIMDFITTGSYPQVEAESFGVRLGQPAASFVTLTKHGALRGCIGNIVARDPLWQSVMHNAVGAAFRDSRFPPLDRSELPELHIEISVLSEPQPLMVRTPQELLSRIRPGVDGVLLKMSGSSATYLPQVWEKLPGVEEFLNSLARKAGLPSGAWREPDASVLTYQVEVFEEPEQAGSLSSR